jgi:hypothetical protein
LAVAALLLLTGCRSGPRKEAHHVISPKAFATLADLVPQVHSVIEGDVSDISFDDRDCEGPRTIIHLTRVSALLGSPPAGSTLDLRVFGGPRANGGWISISEAPRYILGAHYVLFLRNTDWRFSPVIGGYAFRLETLAGKPVLVDSDGHIITGLTDEGIQLGAQVTAPAGQAVKGMQRPTGFQPAASAGSATVCGPNDQRACGSTPPTADLQQQHQLHASGRFARPPQLEGITAQTVARAATPAQLLDPIRRWADEHHVNFGGYFAPVSRFGCWSTTPVVGALHRRAVITRQQ